MRFLGGKLQPPRSGHGQARDLADDRAQPAMPDAFLHAGEDRLVVAGLNIDDPVRFEAGLRQRRGEQVWAGDAPQDLAPRSRRHTAGEQRCCRTVDGAIAAACDFMQRAERQSAARESCVDFGYSERKYRYGAPASALDLLDPRAQ